MTLDRLNRRRSLVDQFESEHQRLEQTATISSLSKYQDLAYSLLTSRKIADALDTRKESNETRNLYGMSLFGQGCLAGRRLLDAGAGLVSPFSHAHGLAADACDPHRNHPPRLH
ncbi:MAG: DUF1501 domain-containing protein, partial [Planctomycetaceae bacterium]|nr:DUF1501 domain-containing protein [Planctomycetaceae bacterium]